MAAITVQNFDGAIITSVATALTEATLSGVTIFESVTVATSEAQAIEAQFKEPTPRVIILYETSIEEKGIEEERCVTVALRLFIAGKVVPAIDEAARLTEILRLMNLAKNAIEETRPADAQGWEHGEDEVHPPWPIWGEADITPTEDAKPPWVACILPVTFGYGITESTRH